MNCFTLVKHMAANDFMPVPLNFCVSGVDMKVRNSVLSEICAKTGKNLIILDDSGNSGMLNIGEIQSAGYEVKNGFSGEFCFYNPLQINSIRGMSRLRELMGAMEYSERQKQKLIAYLNFIKHLEKLSGAEENEILTFDILSSYSSNMYVEMKIQKLVSEHIIDSEQQLYLLSKYSEVCDAAADFENTFYILAPYIKGNNDISCKRDLTAFLFQLKEMETDVVMKNIVTQLLLYSFAENFEEEFAVIILDRGMGKRPYISNFLSALPEQMEVHMISEDIFTLGDANVIQMLINRFAVRIYSRHLSMDSVISHEISHILYMDAVFHRIVFANIALAITGLIVSSFAVTSVLWILFGILCLFGICRGCISIFFFSGISKMIKGIFELIQRLVLFVYQTIMGIVSRKNEYRADQYACSLGYGNQLKYFLSRFIEGQDSRQRTFRDIIYASHPDTYKRIERIEQHREISLEIK